MSQVSSARYSGFDVPVHFEIRSVLRDGAYAPHELGEGEYAKVFSAWERVPLGARDGNTNPLLRPIAAKIFKDNAPPDYLNVFAAEVEVLQKLQGHENIVGLRGIIDEVPPTFVCQECGTVFHCLTCTSCPQGAAGALENDPVHTNTLHCTKNPDHVFRRHKPADLLAMCTARPCGHKGNCTPVTFLFRPCIFFDELHHHLRDFVSLVTGTKARISNHQVATAAERDIAPDEWSRETFLKSLGVLLKAAEGLAYVHDKGQLHEDLAPENVMVLLPQPVQHRGGGIQTLGTRLVDFGRAKPAEDPNFSGVVRGRILFMAPERKVSQNPIGPTNLYAEQGTFREGETCLMEVLASSPSLLPGDLVFDGEDGNYSVMERIVDTEGVSSEPTLNADYRLKIIRPSSVITPSDDRLMNHQMWMNPVRAVPSDIYSLGCLILWLVTAGNDALLDDVLPYAEVATKQAIAASEALTESRLGPVLHRKLMRAIWLPDTADDDEIRHMILKVVACCLVRGESAYCRDRAAASNGAALRAANDLRLAYDNLFFLHRTTKRFSDWKEAQKPDIEKRQAEIEELRTLLAEERAKSERTTALLAEANAKVSETEAQYVKELKTDARREILLLRQEKLEQRDQYERSLAGLQAQHKQMIEKMNQEITNELARADQQLAAVQTAHQTTLQQVAADHQARLEAAELARQTQIAELQELGRQMEAAHKNEIERVGFEQLHSFEKLNTDHEAQLAERRQELIQLRTGHEQETAKLNAKWKADLTRVEKDLREEIGRTEANKQVVEQAFATFQRNSRWKNYALGVIGILMLVLGAAVVIPKF